MPRQLPDFLLICQTWCDDAILFVVKSYDEYTIIRRDRNIHGGGVLLMALKQDQLKKCAVNNFNDESVWCECKLGGDLFIFGCIYRPLILDLLCLKDIIN